MPRKRNHQKEIRGAIYSDQHGRPWETTYDLQALGTCQAPMAYRWDAPVYPPPAYFAEFPDRPLTFQINYEKWISDLDERAKEYRNQCVELARKMNSKPDAPDVLEIVGRAPYPADMPRACRANNRWALGLVKDWRTRWPKWAEAYKAEFWGPEAIVEQAFADVEGGYADTAPIPVADEKYGHLEEQFDPEALGHQRQRTVKMKPEPKPQAAVAAAG